jgi:hypothetical protein
MAFSVSKLKLQTRFRQLFRDKNETKDAMENTILNLAPQQCGVDCGNDDAK